MTGLGCQEEPGADRRDVFLALFVSLGTNNACSLKVYTDGLTNADDIGVRYSDVQLPQ